MTRDDPNYGEWIRTRRRERGLSLDQVSAATRIDRQYLEALEAGNIALLPEPYMRAFLKTYATFLGLDGTEAVRRFEIFVTEQDESLENLRSSVRDRESRRPVPPAAAEEEKEYVCTPPTPRVPRDSRPGRGPRRLAVPLGALLLVAILALAAVTLFGGRGERGPVGGGADPAEAQTHSAAPAETPVPESEQETPAPPPENVPVQMARQQFMALAREDTWMQAIADGDTVVTRVIPAGNRVEVAFSDTLTVKLGKNRGMQLFLNDTELTDLGNPGFVLALVLTPDGVARRRLTYPPETIPDYLNIPPRP